MRPSESSAWRTFAGFSAVCIVAALFVVWLAVSAHAPRPEPGIAAASVAPGSQDTPQSATAGNSSVPVGVLPQATPVPIEASVNTVTESPSVAVTDVPAATTIASGNSTTVPDETATIPAVTETDSPAVSSDAPPAVPVEHNVADDESKLALGKKLFVHEWRPNDTLAGGGDGLGPVFNGRSCVECHSQGGLGGAGSNEHSVHAYEILPAKAGDTVRSGVIHAFATSAAGNEDLAALEQQFRPGKVVAGLTRAGSNELTSKRDIDATRLVWINTPSLWGLGRIDQLSKDQLEQAVNTAVHPGNQRTGVGVQGRFRIHPDGRIGKFGWKGQFASLQEFVAAACANELGLSNEYAAQYAPREFHPDPDARHDLKADQVDAMVRFVASLPEPKQVMPTDAKHRAIVQKGEELFGRMGCTDCHTRDLGKAKNVYGDYRLHKVEDTLNASEEYYHQNFELEIQPPSEYPRLDEWKTAALWGVADTAPYWHDGSVKTLEAAILRHANEAQPATDAYRQLTREDQESVLSFLNTLHGPAENKSQEAKVALSMAE